MLLKWAKSGQLYYHLQLMLTFFYSAADLKLTPFQFPRKCGACYEKVFADFSNAVFGSFQLGQQFEIPLESRTKLTHNKSNLGFW